VKAPPNARPGPLGLDRDGCGILLRALDLRLDPVAPPPDGLASGPSAADSAAGAPDELTFVSHVHAGAIAPSAPALASHETLALMGALGMDAARTTALDWGGAIERPIRSEYGGGTARVSIAPAGHVLGAAQLVVDHPRGRFVYTGDWSPYGGETHRPGAAIGCDELLITCTFGLPIFRFDPPDRTTTALVDWCRATLSAGTTPVVLSPSPGPAQAIVRALTAAGLPVVATTDLRRVCDAYEALGVALGPVGDIEGAGRSPRGARARAVLVAPPGSRASELRVPGPRAVAYASGWALLDAAVEQRRADAAFALGDQADFDALVALVDATGARAIHAARGDAAVFAHALRQRGRDADAIDLPAIDARGTS
jgi:hypothetical protein